MSNTLTSLGYKIQNSLIGHVDWNTMRDSIIDFFTDQKIDPKDTLLFYYSGHGIPDIDGDMYLSTSEIDPNLPSKRGFSFNQLTKFIQGSISTRIVAILDCCYSGAARVSKGSNKDDSAILGNIAIRNASKVIEGEGKCILASSQELQRAYAISEYNHSIYTYYLLQGLRGNESSVDDNGWVTPDSLTKYIYNEMMSLPSDRKPQQQPFRRIEGSGDIILAYYPQFMRRNTGTVNSFDVPSLILKGEEFFDNKDYQKAFEYWDDITRKFPLPEAWDKKGLAVLNLGKLDEAVRCFDVSIQLDPTNADAWEHKGICLINKGQFDEALVCVDKAITFTKGSEKDSVKCMRWFYRGESLYNLGNNTEALECYEKSIEFYPKAELALAKKGDILLEQGKTEEAELCYDNALETDPNLSIALFGKGKVKSRQNKYREALSFFDMAIENANKYTLSNIDVFHLSKGISLVDLKEYVQALDSFEKALEINPKREMTLHFKGLVLESLERYDEALLYYNKVLEINPSNSNVSVRKQNIVDFLASSGGRHYDSDGNVV